MDIKAEEKGTIQRLERLLDENSKVLVFPFIKKNSEILLRIYDMLISMSKEHKALLLTDIQGRERASNRVCIISTQEMEYVLKIYRMYEFSDRFVLFWQEEPYCGSLINYVKNGLLTEEECLRAMLEG